MLIRQACNLAKKADAVLLWLGLDEGGEAECKDRDTMKLPENQIALLNALAEVNPNIAVVLSCGCAVEMDWDSKAKAVLHGYLGGQAGALAIARLVMGKANVSGKLAETIPLCYSDVPSASYYPGMEATSEYREGIYVGYRYFDTARKAVKYPFGYGLSYTAFAYSGLSVCHDRVSFRIRNTGSVYGEEIAQLYIHGAANGVFRPEQELKGFVKAALQPGEEKEVSIALNDRSFAVWSIAENRWVVEPGSYELRIGASSRDIRLTAEICRQGLAVENPYKGERFAPYYSGQVENVPDESFEALLGRPIPNTHWDKTAPIGFNDTISQGVYLSGGLGKGLYNLVAFVRNVLMAMEQKEMANNVMFAMDMPWRNVGRMSGILSDKQIYALLDIINRKKGGFRAFVKTWIQ